MISTFGPYRLDLHEGLLTRGGRAVPITPKPLEALVLFLRNRGRVLGREELMAALWPGVTVSEANLKQTIWLLRKTIEVEGETYVETVPRRGYRFVALAADAPSPDSSKDVAPVCRMKPRTLAALAASALVVFVAASILRSTVFRPNPPRVAVLGFRDLGAAPGHAWLSTALVEMLDAEISAGDAVRCVPGEDVARMRLEVPLPEAESLGKETLARIRRKLDCDYVLLGSFVTLPEGGAPFRLSARLQSTATGETVVVASERGSEAELFDLVNRSGIALRAPFRVADPPETTFGGVRASLARVRGGTIPRARGVRGI